MINLLVYIFLFLFSFFPFGFNVDLTKPNDLMNVIYHETTNFEEHKRNEQNAVNRGETGSGIFSLKNFGNENTNGMSKTDWMKENNLTIGSTGSLSLLNDVNNSQIGNGEGNTSILGTVAVAGKVGLWVWSTYIAGKSAENVGSNIASWENGPDENGLYMTEYGSKVSGNALLYSTSKNSLGLITSIGTAGGSNLISGLGFTSIGATGLMEDGFIYSQGKNSAGYYENLSGQYMTDSDLAIDAGFNFVSVGLGGYQVKNSVKVGNNTNKSDTTVFKANINGKTEVRISDLQNKAQHIFNNKLHNHNMEDVLKLYSGDSIKATKDIANEVSKKINSLGISIPPKTVKDISIKIKGIDVEVRIYSLPNGNYDLNSAWKKI